MKRRRRSTESGGYERIFIDMVLMMLGTFIFVLVVVMITSRVNEKVNIPRMKQELADLKEALKQKESDNSRLYGELDEMAGMGTDAQIEKVLQAVGLDSSTGRRDFDVFIRGLKDIPGKDIHLVIDATGSMHGAATFLVPLLRVIVIRSGKELSALTWFADGAADTYQGTMGEILDNFMKGAPFMGNNETIGDAFVRAAQSAPKPGAYVLLGDEPSDDRIYYLNIPAPVFTIPIGLSDPGTKVEYQALADKTHGKLLPLTFKGAM